MATRQLAGGQVIHGPNVDTDELTESAAGFESEFEMASVLVDGGDFAGAAGEGAIEGSVLRQVDLSGAKLGPLTLVDAVLRGADLSNASLQQVVARRVELRTCRAIGLKLSIELGTDLAVEDCRLDYAIVHIEKAKGITAFLGCSFREATISGNLSNVVFADCDFIDTEFRVNQAKNCDLRTSRIDSARGLLSLRGATISPEQAVAASGRIATEAGLIVAN
jgi:uncharacterized protein YjbI with pentapeptide repeats